MTRYVEIATNSTITFKGYVTQYPHTTKQVQKGVFSYLEQQNREFLLGMDQFRIEQ